ncbi:MAG: hypothetical protein ABR601_09130, partial [Parasphingopyxis sp.]
SPVHPEPVEGLSFFCPIQVGERGFDKLSPNGAWIPALLAIQGSDMFPECSFFLQCRKSHVAVSP